MADALRSHCEPNFGAAAQTLIDRFVRGGWKMEEGWPIGRRVTSESLVNRGVKGRKPKRFESVPHWSSRSAANTKGEAGRGTFPEQLGPEQGKRRSGRERSDPCPFGDASRNSPRIWGSRLESPAA